MTLRSYPKVWNLGHPAIKELFDGPVCVQEKIDGSQFSFGLIDGVLQCRSKGAQIHLPTNDKLFKAATETAQRLANEGLLKEGWIYRGETLYAPKHNVIEYNRTPSGNIILFDIDTGLEDRLLPSQVSMEGSILGLETVRCFVENGVVHGLSDLKKLLENESALGGATLEGIVIKNYSRWGDDGKMLMGKWVREDFKEQHRQEWKSGGRKDIVQGLIERYRTPARWQKAVQHRRERGELLQAPQDIGPLINEVRADVGEEAKAEIMEALWKEFWPKIKRGVTAGLPEWYKEQLAEKQFKEEQDAVE